MVLLTVCRMAQEDVAYRDSRYWITDARVPLDSVVYAFLEGLSSESIMESCDRLYRRTRDGHRLFDKKLRNSSATHGAVVQGRVQWDSLTMAAPNVIARSF
jgi:hypothetical protein